MVTPQKLPPFDADAEEGVLGSLLLDSEAITKVASFLRADDFYREKNQWIYQACFALYERSEAIDQISVAREMARIGRLEAAGGAGFLSQMVASVPTPLHVEHYAQIVQRLSVMRQLIVAGGQIASIGYSDEPKVDAALSMAENLLFRLRYGGVQRDFVHIRQVLDRYLEDLKEEPGAATQGKRPVRTHFVKLDEYLGGLQPADFIVLGARPGLGKTSLALNIAGNVALLDKARVAFFSLEMSSQAVVQRLLSSEAGVDSTKMRLGTQNAAEEKRIMDAHGRLSEAEIYIDDSPLQRVADMRNKTRRLDMERGVDLVIVDYLGLMQGDRRIENRVQEMSEITRALKAMARDLGVPVLAVSQLSRALEQRTSRRPQLSDLRDSGSIEQDADVVLFIYRDDYYFRTEADWADMNADKPYPKGIAEIIIAKHRNGPTGEFKLRFKPEVTKFENLPEEYEVTPV